MTPSERVRRIKAAKRALIGRYRHELTDTWLAEAALDAADEAVPVVSLAAVLDVLDRAYHPQMGENPTHPVDVVRAAFSGEEGTEA